jgi:hypothetical protein
MMPLHELNIVAPELTLADFAECSVSHSLVS